MRGNAVSFLDELAKLLSKPSLYLFPFPLCIEDPSKEALTWVLLMFTLKTSLTWMRSRWLSISPGGMGGPSEQAQTSSSPYTRGTSKAIA